MHQRPASSEYAPFYAGYIDALPPGDVLELLEAGIEDTLELLRGVPEERADHRYAPDRWSVRELAGHLADTERVMGVRALRFARGDQTPLPGFDQDLYVANAAFGRRPLEELAEELRIVRAGTLLLFRGMDSEAWTRRGTANGAVLSVRAIAHIIAGHERHHARVLRERYGVGG